MNQNEDRGTIVYVTIGVPFSHIPIMTKVMMFIEADTNSSPAKVAKSLRKQVADNIENHGWVKGTNFTPAELYYEVYGTIDAEKPFSASVNAPFYNSAC